MTRMSAGFPTSCISSNAGGQQSGSQKRHGANVTPHSIHGFCADNLLFSSLRRCIRGKMDVCLFSFRFPVFAAKNHVVHAFVVVHVAILVV
jgi:hypothetical protein